MSWSVFNDTFSLLAIAADYMRRLFMQWRNDPATD